MKNYNQTSMNYSGLSKEKAWDEFISIFPDWVANRQPFLNELENTKSAYMDIYFYPIYWQAILFDVDNNTMDTTLFMNKWINKFSNDFANFYLNPKQMGRLNAEIHFRIRWVDECKEKHTIKQGV
jgi:hypothetical protein